MREKANFGSMDQQAQFYFLNSHFNQKSKKVKMCKNFFYTFLHFQIFNLNQLSKNKIEPTEPIEPIELKLDFSIYEDEGSRKRVAEPECELQDELRRLQKAGQWLKDEERRVKEKRRMR